MIDFLGNKVVKEFVNVLVAEDPESRQLYLQSIRNESGRGTQNSRHIHKWDQRYNSILDIADKHGLKHIKLDRGALWEAVLVLGPENEVIVFFSSSNLKKIIRSGKDNHYLKLLNMFNEKYDEIEPLAYQTELFNANSNAGDDFKAQAREMLDMMEQDPSKVIVFSFDTSFVSTVKASMFNTNHELIWKTYQPLLTLTTTLY